MFVVCTTTTRRPICYTRHIEGRPHYFIMKASTFSGPIPTAKDTGKVGLLHESYAPAKQTNRTIRTDSVALAKPIIHRLKHLFNVTKYAPLRKD